MSSGLSIYLIAPLLGWFVAHAVKFVRLWVKSGGKEKDLSIFLRAGGMPSSHTAVMVATLTVVGAREGLDSALFGLGVAVTAVIIYDSLNVRRSVGEQGTILLKMLADTKSKDTFFAAQGHTFTEVIGGFVVGVLVGLALLQIL